MADQTIPVNTTGHISATVTQGTPSYQFNWMVTDPDGLQTTLPNSAGPHSYLFSKVSVPGVNDYKISLTTIDSCPSGAKTATSTYIVTVTAAAPTLTSISLAGCSTSIPINGTCVITPTCRDQNNIQMTCPGLSWASSNSAIAQVNSGVVTGISAGSVNITASSGSVSSTIVITVQQSAPVLSSITLSGCSTSIGIGGTCNITYVCKDQFGIIMTCPVISWTSNNPAIAQVNAGIVTGVASGTATITASSGGVSSTLLVSVQSIAPVLSSITLSGCTTAIGINGTCNIGYVCKDQAGNIMTCPALAWTSNNPSVATVSSSGVVTGVSVGATNISASSGGVSSTIGVSVQEGAQVLGSIALTGCTSKIEVGKACIISYTCRDQSSLVMACPVLTWTSSNPAVAVVNKGIVTGIAPGLATISASSGGVSDNVPIEVVTALPVDNTVYYVAGGAALAAALIYFLTKGKR